MAAIEFGVLALVAVALVAVYLTMKVVKPLVYNAIVALGGVPGAVLVSLLALLDVAFVPALLV